MGCIVRVYLGVFNMSEILVILTYLTSVSFNVFKLMKNSQGVSNILLNPCCLKLLKLRITLINNNFLPLNFPRVIVK